jgi:hypothetical protein
MTKMWPRKEAKDDFGRANLTPREHTLLAAESSSRRLAGCQCQIQVFLCSQLLYRTHAEAFKTEGGAAIDGEMILGEKKLEKHIFTEPWVYDPIC